MSCKQKMVATSLGEWLVRDDLTSAISTHLKRRNLAFNLEDIFIGISFSHEKHFHVEKSLEPLCLT